MPKERNPKADEAEALFLQGMKLVEIASKLDLPEGTVRRWKSTYRWDNERSDKKANVRKKGGAPKGNKNAVGEGAPLQNKNAEKHGLFTKYLPAETLEIIDQMPKDSLDVIWDQIQIAYAAIVRAQQIMYVKDRDDETTTRIGESSSATGGSEKWEVQQAWDKQATFLKAQARAQGELRSLIKQYDELLHKNWDMASEEQRARIENIKANTAKLKGDDPDEGKANDGFLDALRGEAESVWEE